MENNNIDEEIKKEDLADVRARIHYEVGVSVHKEINCDNKNLSLDELIAKKRKLEALKKIALNEYVLHGDVTPEDFRRGKRF